MNAFLQITIFVVTTYGMLMGGAVIGSFIAEYLRTRKLREHTRRVTDWEQ